MQSFPFSLERALRITAPVEPKSSLNGVRLREGKLFHFDDAAIDPREAMRRTVRWDSTKNPASRLCGLEVIQLHAPSYSVTDGGTGLMLTYVLRQSPVGLRWRNSLGESSILEPGAMFVSQSLEDSLVQLAPVTHDEVCECVRLTLRADTAMSLGQLLTPHDFSCCNSESSSVRVMLGRYESHSVHVEALPRLTALDIDMVPFSELEVPVAPHQWAIAILTSGSLQIGGHPVDTPCAIAFFGGEPLARVATQSGASLLWCDVPYVLPESDVLLDEVARLAQVV